MPNFDGGHYYLTTLTPIRVGSPIDLADAQRAEFNEPLNVSFVQRIQAVLGNMPTALQSPATEKIGVNSPFSKSWRTHLCRFVVIEDIPYNGRISDNPLLSAARLRKKPLTPKSVDQLPCAYLMFVVDFDAVKEPGTSLPDRLTEAEQNAILDDYLEAMWALGSAELSEIYQNCQEFSAKTIQTPKDFATYMRKCQIETWMPFNDYYIDPPKLSTPPILPLAGAWALLVLATLIAALAWLTGFATIGGFSTGLLALAGVVLSGASFYALVKYINAQGMKPWPAAKYGDLPSVLKGLYLQQQFSDFVVAQQSATPEARYEAFGEFLKAHKPGDVLDAATTQPPGVISSRKEKLHDASS
jgi:hypothetical protein